MSCRDDDDLNVGEPSTPSANQASLSLSDRTIETLAQTPSGRRRRSSFFAPDSPGAPTPRPLSRPASAMSGRGPVSGISSFKLETSGIGAQKGENMRRTSLSTRPFSKSTATPRQAQPLQKFSTVKTPSRTSLQSSAVKRTPKAPISGSKTVSGRLGGSSSRPALAGLFREPNAQVATDMKGSKPSGIAASPSGTAKSSSALREQIRMAKAARQSLSTKQDDQTTTTKAVEVDHYDPFNQMPSSLVMKRRVEGARSDGRLNISAMGLKDIPEEVLKMYDYEYNVDSSASWAEVVDLIRFSAADNELETIADEVFPDINPHSLGQDDESTGPQFAGIEVLDLHGNLLTSVPAGLRWLERLSVLNLVSRLKTTLTCLPLTTNFSPATDWRTAHSTSFGR